MASNAILEQKKKIVEDIVSKIKNSCAGVLVNYQGITVEDDTKLRAELRKNGVEYAVIKNTYLSKAFDQTGLEVLKGGYVDGEVLDKNALNELAKTPSKEELLVRMMSSMQSSLYKLCYGLQAIIDKDGEAPAEAAAE